MDLPEKKYCVMLHVGNPYQVRLELGDITKSVTDAIVNAANSELLPGSGVCGAIHSTGGPTIAAGCRRIRSKHGPFSPGHAIATTAGNLAAKYVIHTVGPIWHGGDHDEAEILSSCYRESMRIADELKLHSIAFPAISTGVFGYLIEQAAWVAIPSLIESLRLAKHLVLASIVLFDKATLDIFTNAALAQRKPVSGHPYEVSIADYA